MATEFSKNSSIETLAEKRGPRHENALPLNNKSTTTTMKASTRSSLYVYLKVLRHELETAPHICMAMRIISSCWTREASQRTYLGDSMHACAGGTNEPTNNASAWWVLASAGSIEINK